MNKKYLITAIAIAATLAVCAGTLVTADQSAADCSGTCGENLKWSYAENDHTLTISGYGDMEFSLHSPWYDFRAEIQKVVMPEGLTSVGSYAFDECSSLTEVTIPSSVTFIGYCAFWGCTSLTEVTIPSSVTTIYGYAFSGCSSLTEINVDANNTKFSSLDGILYDKEKTELIKCPGGTSLTSVTVPSSVTSIRSEAFDGCPSLISVTIPSSVTYIGFYVFGGCTSLTEITIPSSVTYIEDYAFAESSLQTVYDYSGLITPGSYGLSDDVQVISCNTAILGTGNGALNDSDIPTAANESGTCGDHLTWVYTEKDHTLTITGYGDMADFSHSFSPWYDFSQEIEKVVMPEGLRSIAMYTFQDCTSLTWIIIPSTVISIGNYAFTSCSSLESVAMPSVTSIGDRAFADCSSLITVTMPSVTHIGSGAFQYCTSLISVAMPSVTHIGCDAFRECTILESIAMPSVTYISPHVFEGCTYLKSVTMPSVTHIGAYAFQCCTSLTSITIPSSLTFVSSDAFCYSSIQTVYDYSGLIAPGSYGLSDDVTVVPSNMAALGAGNDALTGSGISAAGYGRMYSIRQD